MIKSFKCKETEKIFKREHSRKVSHSLSRVALRKLLMIHAATQLNALRIPPSNNLESLKGDRKGQYSVRINQQWRICFKWQKGDAYNVEIVDYH